MPAPASNTSKPSPPRTLAASANSASSPACSRCIPIPTTTRSAYGRATSDPSAPRAPGSGAAFKQRVEGSLEPGKLADFILLDRDLFRIEPSEIGKTEVLITVVGGKIVYQSPNWKDSALAEKTAKKK